ncbi:MAG TPA: hypothetical protein VFM65_00480 [Flavobacteriaceae bacterium]|nr:hypothetical protein [Flavobacteriaceae bacterium]
MRTFEINLIEFEHENANHRKSHSYFKTGRIQHWNKKRRFVQNF